MRSFALYKACAAFLQKPVQHSDPQWSRMLASAFSQMLGIIHRIRLPGNRRTVPRPATRGSRTPRGRGRRCTGSPTPIVRNHQHQERTLGKVQPMCDSCLGTLGETHDGLILVEPLQTKVLQAQDVVDLTASIGTSFPSSRDLASILIYRGEHQIRLRTCSSHYATCRRISTAALKAGRSSSVSLWRSVNRKRPLPPGPLHQRPSCSSACRHVALRGPNLRGLRREPSRLQKRAAWPGCLAEACAGPFFKSFDQLP